MAWRTLRFRLSIFLGTLLALSLGVCLIAVTLLCVAGVLQGAKLEEDQIAAIALLGNAAGVSTVAAVFVITGTFSFAVTQRRREFALLRAVGATPRQVRHLVMGEAVFIGIAAAIIGCLAGIAIAPMFAEWLVSVELVSAGFRAHIIWWPLAIAATAGLVSALLSAWTASRRAAKAQPAEALLEITVERRAMTLSRWLWAIAAFGGAGGLLPLLMGGSSAVAGYIMLVILLLILGGIMVSPIIIGTLVYPIKWLARRPVTTLAAANILTGMRRTSSTIAPLFITITLAAAAFSSTVTLAETRSHAVQSRVTAPLVVTSNDGNGLTEQTLRALRAADRNAIIEPVAQSGIHLTAGRTSDQMLASWYVAPSIGSVMHMPVIEGDLARLTGDNTVAVSKGVADTQNWLLGNKATFWLTGSDPIALEVVAILQDSDDLGHTALLPDVLRQKAEPNTLPQVAYIAPAEARTALESIAMASGATIQAAQEFLAEQSKQDTRLEQVALITVIGLSLLYTAISIANTCIMATTGRLRDFAILQLSGMTRRQIRVMLFIETSLMTMIALAMAVLVTIITLAITAAVAVNPQLVIPWQYILATIAACFSIALLANIFSAQWTFRQPAIHIAAARE